MEITPSIIVDGVEQESGTYWYEWDNRNGTITTIVWQNQSFADLASHSMRAIPRVSSGNGWIMTQDDLDIRTDHLLLIGGSAPSSIQAYSVPNPLPDELIFNEGPSGRWMAIPISHEEIEIMRRLPKPAKEEFKENIHKYIEQVGKDHKPLTAMPLDEAPYALG